MVKFMVGKTNSPQATREVGSSRMHASRTASETWSQILSRYQWQEISSSRSAYKYTMIARSIPGCPSLTDSDVKRKESDMFL
jgi:hypothetical protein